MRRNLWFTSDHHFRHCNILQFTDRPYDTIEDMEKDYIKKWNKRIKPNDLVYICGDHIWNSVKKPAYLKLNNKLNGNKVLVIGNHDDVKELQAMNLGYICAVREARIRLGNVTVRLSHYPYAFGFWKNLGCKLKALVTTFKWIKVKHQAKRPQNDGSWLLHGHTHSKNKVNGNMIHIGVDSWNGMPVSGNEIVKIIKNT